MYQPSQNGLAFNLYCRARGKGHEQVAFIVVCGLWSVVCGLWSVVCGLWSGRA